MKKGFTLIEIIVAIFIISALVGISFSSLNNLNNSSALDTETNTILSMVERARARTLSSENDIEYGIHFASTTAVLFVGKTYTVGSSTNETETINSKVKVNSINFSSGVKDIYFYRLSGKPSATGTVVFSLASNSFSTKTLTVYATGISDIK